MTKSCGYARDPDGRHVEVYRDDNDRVMTRSTDGVFGGCREYVGDFVAHSDEAAKNAARNSK